jgi:hypothetical protein
LSNAGNPQTPYEANTDPPAWWREAIDAIPWQCEKLNDVVLWYQKTGPCPRCHDDRAIRASLEAEGWVGMGPQEDTDVFVPCRCAGDHVRPQGVLEGCGWGGYVAGPVPGRVE